MAVRTFMDGPWQAKGIMPYMNQREFFDPNDLSLLAAFAPNSSITFQWLEDGSRPLYTVGVSSPSGQYLPRVFNIEANGLYGTDERRGAGHFPWVHIIPQAPNTVPLNRLQNEWLFQDFGGIYTVANTGDLAALTLTLPRTQLSTLNLPFLNNNVKGQWEWNTREKGTFYAFHSYAYVTSTQKWWVYTRVNGIDSQLGNPDVERWIPALIKNNTNIQVTFTEQFVWNQSLTTGDTTLATIYTAVAPMSDIYHPSWIGGEVFVPNDVYSVCFDGNSRHAYSENGLVSERPYDAAFLILPPASPIYSQYFDRTELNSRVAGEKALYEDEFLTASQVEAGTNVTLRWRNLDGSLTGYSTDAVKGGNLVIEATGGGGGNSAVEGRTYGPFHTNPAATIYYDETTATIRFQDEPLWYTDAMVLIPDTKLPIEFDVVGDPVVNPTTSVIRARAINNNLHCSVTQLNTVNYYPMALANDPFLTDWTVNHIRFVNTENIDWNVKGDVMPTLMPDDSTAVRQGIIIEPVLNGLYVNWRAKSGRPELYGNSRQQLFYNDDSLNVDYTVDSLDTVEFFGRNGVVCTLEGLFENKLRVMIDRKLSVQSSNNRQQIGDNTTRIEFRSFLGNDLIELFPFSNGDDSNLKDGRYSLVYLSDNINLGGSRFRTPVLPVTFTVNSSTGINEEDMRIVRGWYPKQVRRWASQWSKTYDNTNSDAYRILSNQTPYLPIGFWGFGSTSNGESVYTPAPNSNWNMLCGDSQDAPWYNFRYADWNDNAPGGPLEKPVGLSGPWEDGIYFIQATVQGIMGIQPDVQAGQLNPVISQSVHLHLVTSPDLALANTNNFQNKRLQSLDIMRDYGYIAPTVQAQTGYMQAVNSRPWSMQGSGLFYLKERERIFGLLTYNPGNGENRFFYQVCYVKMSCFKVATAADMKLGSIAIDADGFPTMYNFQPQRWHDMIFF
jgi:hypothetical protein